MTEIFTGASIILLSVLVWMDINKQRDITKMLSKMQDDLTELKKLHAPAPIEICKLQPTVASLNLVKEKEERKKPKERVCSEEHKAKLSAARKAFWEKKKAAEQKNPVQPPENQTIA